MSSKDDAAPFVVLQKDADTFKQSFQHDIDDCICTLNSKITSLICEPEALSNPFGDQRRNNSAHSEFDKAKYDIFLNVKSFINDMEDKWAKSIAQMKDTFLESVELFLAGTKLEVKFPSATELALLSTKTSPLTKEKKSPNSIYPSLHHLDETFVSAKRDLRRKTFCIPKDAVSALNLSPLKQNLCDIEEEEINDDIGNVVEFSQSNIQDEDMCFPHDRVSKTNRRKKTMQEKHEEDLTDEDMCFAHDRVSKTNPRRKTMQEKHDEEDLTDEDMCFPHDRVSKSNPRRKTMLEKHEDDLTDEEMAIPQETVLKTNPRRKTMHQRHFEDYLIDSSICSPQERVLKVTPRRKTMIDRQIEQNMIDKQNLAASAQNGTRKRSLNTRAVDPELDSIEFPLSPALEHVKVNTRRKTIHSKVADNDMSDFTPERTTRTKSKRKTMNLIDDIDESLATPSPKRLKQAGNSKTRKSSTAGINTPVKGFSLMDCDESVAEKTIIESPSKHNYGNWVSIQSITDNVPDVPGVYELKVWRAKKTAYIGCAESLFEQLMRHKKMQNSGHKHLDKFLERNVSDVQVRFEELLSVPEAKVEVKNRIKEFVEKFKTTPAYN